MSTSRPATVGIPQSQSHQVCAHASSTHDQHVLPLRLLVQMLRVRGSCAGTVAVRYTSITETRCGSRHSKGSAMLTGAMTVVESDLRSQSGRTRASH